MAIADNKFTLAAADRHHRVDGLQASLHRLRHRLAGDDAWRDALDRRCGFRLNRALAVNGLTKRIHNASKQACAYWHLEDSSGALDRITFDDMLVVSKYYSAHRVLLEVKRQAEGVVGKLQHLTLHSVSQTMHTANPISKTDHGTFGTCLSSGIKILYPFLDQFADFGGVQLHRHSLIPREAACGACIRRQLQLPISRAGPELSRQ